MKAHLVFAVVADVVHAHENSQQLPVLLKVQPLQEGGDGTGAPEGHKIPSMYNSTACKCTSYPVMVSIRCLVCPGRLLKKSKEQHHTKRRPSKTSPA